METKEELMNWIAQQEELNNELKSRLDNLENEEQREDDDQDRDNFDDPNSSDDGDGDGGVKENNPDSEKQLDEIESFFDN